MPRKATKPKQELIVGRPSVFSEEVFNKIIELYQDGKTEQQVADIIGVHVETVRRWKREKESFRWAAMEAKLLADEMVEASLLKKAIGFNYYEEQATKDGIQSVQKYSVPDTKAQVFWLKNRKPKEWRDTVEYTQEATHKILLSTGDDEEEEFDV